MITRITTRGRIYIVFEKWICSTRKQPERFETEYCVIYRFHEKYEIFFLKIIPIS